MSGDQKVTSDNGKHASGSAEEARKSDQSMADAIRDSGSAALDVATINTRKLLIELEIERILPVFTGDTGKLNGVRFYLQDLQEPVVIDQPVISMGRADPAQNIHPALDLTLHYGLQLGVSRYHAEITHSHSRYFIKDFGSTNGTWINNHRIPTYQQIPIYSGDQIRLGHLALVVRFPQV